MVSPGEAEMSSLYSCWTQGLTFWEDAAVWPERDLARWGELYVVDGLGPSVPVRLRDKLPWYAVKL